MKRSVVCREEQPPTGNDRGLWVLFLCVIAVCLYMGFRHYEEVVEEDKRGNALLREERLEDLQRQQREIETAYICYKLIANVDKYYNCPSCYKNRFFLLAGEIIKYGITSKGIDRYPMSELYKERITFIPIDTGSLEEMRALELELIGLYPLRLENQVRPYRKWVVAQHKAGRMVKLRYKLARPPQNVRD